MNELLPIIAELADARTHVARAEWLKACPIAILRKYDGTIRNRLQHAGCTGGLAYLEGVDVVMQATRDPDTGMPAIASQDILFRAGQYLSAWAANRDAYDAAEPDSGPLPDHSITDL